MIFGHTCCTPRSWPLGGDIESTSSEFFSLQFSIISLASSSSSAGAGARPHQQTQWVRVRRMMMMKQPLFFLVPAPPPSFDAVCGGSVFVGVQKLFGWCITKAKASFILQTILWASVYNKISSSIVFPTTIEPEAGGFNPFFCLLTCPEPLKN